MPSADVIHLPPGDGLGTAMLIFAGLHHTPGVPPDRQQDKMLDNCERLLSEARAHAIPIAYLRHVTVSLTRLQSQNPVWISGFEPTREDMIFDTFNPRPYENEEFSHAIGQCGGCYWLAGRFDEIDCTSLVVDASDRKQQLILISDALSFEAPQSTNGVLDLARLRHISHNCVTTTSKWISDRREHSRSELSRSGK